MGEEGFVIGVLSRKIFEFLVFLSQAEIGPRSVPYFGSGIGTFVASASALLKWQSFLS
jgi:hypothetical protein